MHVTWIGRDVLAWSSGIHVVFYDVVRKITNHQSYVKHSQGEGVCCLSGHPTLPIFAFAEKVSDPRVMVYTYPEMKLMSECPKGGPSGYLATTFTEHEYLVTLASYPHFSLVVWSWRTGERLATVSTGIKDIDLQEIVATHTGPTMIAQLGKESGKLSVWQMRSCGKMVSLKSREVTLPEKKGATAAVWSPEPGPPTLAILDEACHIYVLQHDATVPIKIAQTQRCSECAENEASDICWYRGGIVIKTTFCQIRYYKKISEGSRNWSRIWMVKMREHPYVLTSHPFRIDRLFFHTLEGDLMQLEIGDDVHNSQTPVMVPHLRRGSSYRFIDWIYPWGQHLAAVDNENELSVLETYTGEEISRVHLEMAGKISCLTSRKDIPLFGVTSDMGEVTMLGICDPKEPLILAQFHLHRDSLDLVKFSYSGNYLAAGFSLSGVCFCITSKMGTQFEVITRVEVNRQIVDILLYDTQGHLRLFVLCVTSKRAVTGNQVLLFDLPQGQSRVSAASYVLELLDSFQSLHYSPASHQHIIGSPYLTRQIQLLGIQGWKEVTLLEVASSDHQLRHMNIFVDNRWITSASRDGTVAVRNGNKFRNRVAIITPHHRKDLGAVKGIMKPSGDCIVSLGYDGSLICTKLFDDTDQDDYDPDDPSFLDLAGMARKESGRRSRVTKDDHLNLDVAIVEALTAQHRVYFAPEDERKDKTWEEWKQARKFAEESREHSAARAAILNSFASVKTTINHLMNVNEASPEIERLPVSAFDLDKVSRDQKLKSARDMREDVRCQLEWNCAGRDKVSDWIKSFCWDKQQVQGQSINTIFGRFKVVNYPTVPGDPSDDDSLAWARFSKKFSSDFVVDPSVTFHPWLTLSDSNTMQHMSSIAEPNARRPTELLDIDERQRIDAILEEDEEDTVVDEAEIENQRTLEGTTTHRFIEQSECYYSQFELCSYAQMTVERQMLKKDVSQLKNYFNNLFNDMYNVKEREMSLVLERNERIRHINSELCLMFNQRVPEIPLDPIWNQTEIPDSLIRVSDSEVKVSPYVSPSAQDILNKQAADAERYRLLLLADDFREKALIAMMDGVLEVRWEDLIKKDVPKPECMLVKSPDAYNADDILAVKEYEKEVEALIQEREKYRRILEADYSKISACLTDGIERFKQRLEKFFLTRILVDSAINQLRLRYWRGCFRDMRRRMMYEKEEIAKRMIDEKKGEIEGFLDEVRKQQSVIANLRGNYEAACNREKWQEKKFRSEFPGMAKTTQELLTRQYKRRPKAIQKAVPASYVGEIGKAAVNMTKPFFLTGECHDYLKALDSLDVRPASLPPFIDGVQWEHLVRLRRHKVESEMRVRSISVDIAEAEHTVGEFGKIIGNARGELEALEETLSRRRRERMSFDQDIEVQLVLKMGQIEVTFHGDTENDHVLLIPRSEIEKINSFILGAGRVKLKTMKKTINFGRGINYKEWEHKMLKMKIEDLKEELYSVERITINKEIQEYLKRKAKGLKDDKTQLQLERELELMHKNWEKQLADWTTKLNKLSSRIAKTKRENSILDKKITSMNVSRCEMELQRDVDSEIKVEECREKKLNLIHQRSKLVQKLQKTYSELVILETEYELLRLRRFPTFKSFKILDDN
ncbi:cilia- and flagella-associated protein 43-like [Athalia rosae]|uniref:cilia- and flagella-associated protein 43-like n=1 Tax=Athalia rosae TaxID=37344 RepID=UPI0020340F92|nr:cilia- and flagella-associated protein 43-like [Athalia rosae]